MESRGIDISREADQAGRSAGGPLLTRFEARAAASGHSAALNEALHHVSRSARIIFGGILGVALLGGAAAAQAVLTIAPGAVNGHTVNILAVLIGLLLIQSVLLALWIVVLLGRGRGAALSPLAAGVRGAVAGLAIRFGRGEPEHHAAAVEAVSIRLASPSYGRWRLSAISHLAWTAFNFGALAVLLIMLSTREYHFNWETTILPRSTAIAVTRAVAVVPEAVGFVVPDAATIEASEASVDPELARRSRGAWSGVLIGALICYGLAPRVLLGGGCLLLAARARRRWRPDFDHPRYVATARRLMPETGASRLIAPEAAPSGVAVFPPLEGIDAQREPDAGPPVLLGFEVEPPPGTWPPVLPGVRWNDLGLIESREDRQRVAEELSGLTKPARAVVIVCDLRATPDRGLSSFLAQLAAHQRGPLHLLLTGGQGLRESRGMTAAAERIAVWRSYANDLGLAERHHEVDIEHLTTEGRRQLIAGLGLETDSADGAGSSSGSSDSGGRSEDRNAGRSAGSRSGAEGTSGGLSAALQGIAAAVGTWTQPPDFAAQSQLHRQIAECYGAETARWRGLLGLPEQLGKKVEMKELADAAIGSGRRMLELLPPGVRRHSRWMAAGAVAGAAGCGAAALLLSPVAIGSLPLWSGLGAAVAAAFTPAKTGGADSDPNPDSNSNPDPGSKINANVNEALQAAALFALLLELQGRDEVTIGEQLERTLADLPEPDVAPGRADAARVWLAELRHRFECAETRAQGEQS